MLALRAPRRPRLAQLCFLVVALFLLTSKVWSQQFVLWLIPLAVLARPRWGAFLAWQVAEIGYFLAFYAQMLNISGTSSSRRATFVLARSCAGSRWPCWSASWSATSCGRSSTWCARPTATTPTAATSPERPTTG